MASCSSGLKGHIQKFGWGFSVFQAFGNHSKRQRLDASHSFIAVGTVAHDSGQRWYFGQPPAVLYALKFDGKRHPRTVASGTAVYQPNGADAHEACGVTPQRRAAHSRSLGRQAERNGRSPATHQTPGSRVGGDCA